MRFIFFSLININKTIPPKRNESVPNKPKNCIGRLTNLETKVMDIKSKKPLTKLSNPNFVTPYFRSRCVT